MNNVLKQKFWNVVRPIHSPVTRFLRRKLSSNYADHPEMKLPPPYEIVQLDVERHLHDYLHVSREEIKNIVIVGVHEGDEIRRLMRMYPKANLRCFEPNPNTYKRLQDRYGLYSNVSLSELALGDSSGKARFFELEMPGNGSILEPDMVKGAVFFQWQDKQPASFDVSVSTLDKEIFGRESVDLLWMDVQGAEGKVLRGGADMIQRTRAIFIEVTLVESSYHGAALFEELRSYLENQSFTCVGLGLDYANATGNAFFVRDLKKLISGRHNK